MIGIVVVSHSHALAAAAIALAAEMVPEERRPVVLPAAGLDETAFGTDAAAIAEAIAQADSGDGVLVLLDLGSAVLSAEMALEFGDPDARVLLSPAPLVEGLVAAVVTASTGAGLESCDAEARRGLAAKTTHLGATADQDVDAETRGGPGATADRQGDEPVTATVVSSEVPLTWSVVVDLPTGLHARPAAALVSALSGLDVEASARHATRDTGEADARSAMELLTLDVRSGDTLEITLSGGDAARARGALDALAADDFGEH